MLSCILMTGHICSLESRKGESASKEDRDVTYDEILNTAFRITSSWQLVPRAPA
jgi:hypothetical protein